MVIEITYNIYELKKPIITFFLIVISLVEDYIKINSQIIDLDEKRIGIKNVERFRKHIINMNFHYIIN